MEYKDKATDTSYTVMGSIPTPQMLAGMEWSVMDAATGTEAEKKALADKIRRIPVPERMALVEAVENGGLPEPERKGKEKD